MHKNNNKIKQIHPSSTERLNKQIVEKSLYSQLKQMKSAVVDRSITAFNKLFHKLNETPAVYVLPMQQRRVSEKSQSKLQAITEALSKNEGQDKRKSSSSLTTNRDDDRLKQLLAKRSSLMNRLKAIDKSLQVRTVVPVTVQANQYREGSQNVNFSRFRDVESRINIQNSQTYNLVQHERNVEMLSRLNNERMRRQEKLVGDMRRKQESEMRKLEEIERNRSQMQLSRQLRPVTLSKLKLNNLQKLKSIESIEHIPIAASSPSQRDQRQFSHYQQAVEVQEGPYGQLTEKQQQ